MNGKRRFLSLIFALVLILSMAITAVAASVVYTYDVTKQSTYNRDNVVSKVGVVHTQGTANTIEYSLSAETHTFNTLTFDATYRAYLLEAYKSAGFVEVLTIPAKTSTLTIKATAASGVYKVVLRYKYGTGLATVTSSTEGKIYEKYFSSAPISYSVFTSVT